MFQKSFRRKRSTGAHDYSARQREFFSDFSEEDYVYSKINLCYALDSVELNIISEGKTLQV